MTRTAKPPAKTADPVDSGMNLRLGIKRIEYHQKRATEGPHMGGMVIYMHATFDMRAEELPAAEFTVIVPWTKDLPTTMDLLVRKLGEMGQKIQQLAQMSVATPVPTPPGS